MDLSLSDERAATGRCGALRSEKYALRNRARSPATERAGWRRTAQFADLLARHGLLRGGRRLRGRRADRAMIVMEQFGKGLCRAFPANRRAGRA